jgi:hypothetical protein
MVSVLMWLRCALKRDFSFSYYVKNSSGVLSPAWLSSDSSCLVVMIAISFKISASFLENGNSRAAMNYV